MQAQKTFLTVVIIVAILAVVVGLFAAFASGRTPDYHLKILVTDRGTTADKWFEGTVVEASRQGSTKVLGDSRVTFRLNGTLAYAKNGKRQSRNTWHTKLVNDDIVSVKGNRRSDGTFELRVVVNRSR